MVTARLVVSVVAGDPGITPNSDGLPGLDVLRQIGGGAAAGGALLIGGATAIIAFFSNLGARIG
jgi:hypothetical protein